MRKNYDLYVYGYVVIGAVRQKLAILDVGYAIADQASPATWNRLIDAALSPVNRLDPCE